MLCEHGGVEPRLAPLRCVRLLLAIIVLAEHAVTVPVPLQTPTVMQGIGEGARAGGAATAHGRTPAEPHAGRPAGEDAGTGLVQLRQPAVQGHQERHRRHVRVVRQARPALKQQPNHLYKLTQAPEPDTTDTHKANAHGQCKPEGRCPKARRRKQPTSEWKKEQSEEERH